MFINLLLSVFATIMVLTAIGQVIYSLASKKK